MPDKNININFPFRDSDKGDFLELNNTDVDAVKADLLHLILTNKGERLYNPNFGTDLRKFLFEQYDSITESEIKEEITKSITEFIPNLKIVSIDIRESENSQYGAVVELHYVIVEDVFETKDFVIINL